MLDRLDGGCKGVFWYSGRTQNRTQSYDHQFHCVRSSQCRGSSSQARRYYRRWPAGSRQPNNTKGPPPKQTNNDKGRTRFSAERFVSVKATATVAPSAKNSWCVSSCPMIECSTGTPETALTRGDRRTRRRSMRLHFNQHHHHESVEAYLRENPPRLALVVARHGMCGSTLAGAHVRRWSSRRSRTLRLIQEEPAVPTTAKEDEEEDDDAADADHLLNPFCELSSLLHFISLFLGVSEKY
jgi:hypothetical protein